MVSERDDGVRRPLGVRHGRAALDRLGRPVPQALEDAPYDARIVDSSAITRIGLLHFGHSSGSASYPFRMSRAQEALVRAANALTGSGSVAGFVARSFPFNALARSPRARFEYHPT